MRRLLTRYVVLHHSATKQGMGKAEAIRKFTKWHTERGLSKDGKPAYTVLIGDKWQALVRPEDSWAHHCGNWRINRTSVAVCLIGNFNVDELTKYQEKKLKDQLNNWKSKYNIKNKNVLFHNDIRKTACPGSNINHVYVTSLLVDKHLLSKVNSAFRIVFKRDPVDKESFYYQKRVTTKIPFRRINEYNKLLEVMDYYKSRGKTMGR